MSKWDEIAAQAHERWKAGQPNQPTHPRCETCRWWIENAQLSLGQQSTDGECTRHSKGRSGTPFWTEGIQEADGEGEWRRRFAGLYTERDFYCIAWDAEEAREKEDRR